MEILELLFGGAQLCDCFVGLMSLLSATGGAVEAKRGTANRRARRLAKHEGRTPPPMSRDNWLALILFVLAGAFLAILVMTWLAARG